MEIKANSCVELGIEVGNRVMRDAEVVEGQEEDNTEQEEIEEENIVNINPDTEVKTRPGYFVANVFHD